MWLSGPSTDESDEWAAELEMGAGGWHQERAIPEPVEATPSEPIVAASTDDVEERLGAVAAEEGWDEAEVQAIRAYLSGVMPPEADASPDPPEQPAPPERAPTIPSEFDLPGAEELDEAMAALGRAVSHEGPDPVDAPTAPESPVENPAEQLGVETDSRPEPDIGRAWSKFNDPEADAEEPESSLSHVEWPGLEQEYGAAAPPSVESAPATPARPQPADAHPETADGSSEPEPEWLRGRQDAAARAYRRLRRIFPNPEH